MPSMGDAHLGVNQVDARRVQRGLGRHIGRRLVARGDGVVIGLLADGARGHQRLVAFDQQRGGLLLRLGARQGAFWLSSVAWYKADRSGRAAARP